MLPSGRWVTSADTKHGQLVCHAWDNGSYEITRGKESIGRGIAINGGLSGAKMTAINHARQIIETEP